MLLRPDEKTAINAVQIGMIRTASGGTRVEIWGCWPSDHPLWAHDYYQGSSGLTVTERERAVAVGRADADARFKVLTGEWWEALNGEQLG